MLAIAVAATFYVMLIAYPRLVRERETLDVAEAVFTEMLRPGNVTPSSTNPMDSQPTGYFLRYSGAGAPALLKRCASDSRVIRSDQYPPSQREWIELAVEHIQWADRDTAEAVCVVDRCMRDYYEGSTPYFGSCERRNGTYRVTRCGRKWVVEAVPPGMRRVDTMVRLRSMPGR